MLIIIPKAGSFFLAETQTKMEEQFQKIIKIHSKQKQQLIINTIQKIND